MSISSLQDLFIHTLQDIYFAENLIVKKLPTMVKEASAAPLKKAFEEHLEETRTHVSRLDAVFKILGEKPQSEECPAIEGIIEEAEELIAEISNAKTKDAALIAAGLRGGAYTELLQGAFARRAPFFAQWRVFTRAAALLAVAVLGGVGLLAAEGFALNQRADEIRAETESLFAEAFPEETRIVNPRLQMTTRLRALRSAGKYLATYWRPAASPSAPSTSDTPDFQRGRLSVTPVSTVP